MSQSLASPLGKQDNCRAILEGDNYGQTQDNISADTTFIYQSDKRSDPEELIPLEEQLQNISGNENVIGHTSQEGARVVTSGDGYVREAQVQVDSDGDYDMVSVDTFDFISSSDSEMDEVEDNAKNVNIISRQFDVNLVVKSIERGEPVLEQVRGKDVVLVVGKTGTGKSTLIQAIAGRKLIETEYSSTFIQQRSTPLNTVGKVVYEAVDPLPGFEIGHVKMSKTANIGCYAHNPGDSIPLLFIDSPGFEDTNGHEVDIATSIMLSQVAKRCHSLRFVVMISYVSLLEDRGGAMRSVLRLIRSFVNDFEKEKQSFLFLFTHSSEIAGVPDSIEGARSFLQNEIVRTIEGTADEETRAVLNYIRKSLGRNWPFTNVFLPLKTNVSDLVSSINTKLKPGKKLPHLVDSCGLTQASRLTLGGELQSRLQELRRELDAMDPNMDTVHETLKIFRYFDQYISTENVRGVMQDVNSLLLGYISQQIGGIEIEVERGTSSDHNFGPTNISVVNGILLRLKCLMQFYPDQIDCDYIVHHIIKNGLTKLQGILMLGHRESFNGIHRYLDKMSIWSIGFPQFRTLYQCVINHLASAIEYSITASTVVKNDYYLTMIPSQLEDNIRNLHVLWSVNEDVESLSCHLYNANVAAAFFQSNLKNLRYIVNLWKGNVESYCKGATREEENLYSVARLSSQLNYLNHSFERYPLSSDLKDAIRNLQTQLADELLESFDNFASELNVEAMDKSLQRAEFILARIKLASTLFSGNESELGRSIHTIYCALAGHIKSFVMERVGEINEMAHEAEGGLRDGFRDAAAILGLQSFCWFDNYIQEREKFVENTCIKFERQYNDSFENVIDKVRSIFQEIEGPSIESAEPSISKLKHIFPELQQISSFRHKLKKENIIEVEAKERLQKYCETFVKSAEASTEHWRNTIYTIHSDVKRVEAATQKQESIINKMSVLEGIDPECDVVLNRLRTHIAKTSGGFTNKAKGVMKSKGNYEEKLRFLQTANTLQKFSRVTEKLPDIGKLPDLARNSVADDAKHIEDCVSETSEWDKIDRLLIQFQGAKIIDNFTSNEATSRLRPLLQLRETKQEVVDNLVEQLIQDEDFRGISDFLTPYTKSKDQVKKQKFIKWRRMIDSCLCNILGIVNHNIQGHNMTDVTCERVVVELKKLKQANIYLGEYFKGSCGGINLEMEIKTTHRAINEKVVSLLNNYHMALGKPDYEAMGIAHHFMKIHLTHWKYYVSKEHMDAVKLARKRYRDSLENVPNSVTKFFDSGCKNNDSEFFVILATLKNASKYSCPPLEELPELYTQTSHNLVMRLNQLFHDISTAVLKRNCYDDAIDEMSRLHCLIGRELKHHIVFSELSFNSEEKLVEWRDEKQDIDQKMKFDASDAETKLKQWKQSMNRLDPSKNVKFVAKMGRWYSGSSYHKKRKEIEREISDRFEKGKKALNDSNHSLLNECIQILDWIQFHLGNHVTGADQNCNKLKQSAQECFLGLCKQAQNVLQSEEKLQFEGMFFDYRGFIVEVPCVMANQACKKEFSLTNHFIYDALERDVNEITTSLDNFVYDTLKSTIMKARKFGSFVADECSLLQERIKSCDHEDPWLKKIFNISHENFSYGRNLASIKHFAVLELKPSAKKEDIKKAHRRLAKKFHPDKTRNADSTKFLRVQEAKELLLGVVSSVDEYEKPFSNMIKGIRSTLRQTVKLYLAEQRYERVEKILFKLGDLKTLKSLVTPNLDHEEIKKEVHDLVRSHVSQVKINVQSNWSSKQYRALNDTITDLKLMEDSFKSYTNIFPSSWDDGGIVKMVEDEIEKLGSRAVGYLSNKKSAQQQKDDFRRCFLNMGHVLVELPLFKDYTKSTMCSVLEACLKFEWGYSFLFDFGLGLQRGEKSDSDDDNHVAQTLVGEFSHFKEVMTMVWNEETSQKPAEDTVRGIKGQYRTSGSNEDLPIDKGELLRSFEVFDAEYKKLLGEYIEPEADLKKLVNKITALTETFRPINCTSGWDQNVKDQIPNIIAAVFSVFTVLKSGTSYNRLGSANGDTDMGQKLLMKPHNIQVLTLLSLFGCGSASATGLDSHLMQIRTGEGKSMILGAAAVVLALLGFRVRCVCYSEYLSDRDFHLFQDIFDKFSVTQFVKYSKITTLSEDTTATKGDIRNLTEALLRGHLKEATAPKSPNRSIFEGQDARDLSFPQRQTRQSSRKKQHKVHINETSITSSNPVCATSATISTGRKEILLVDEVDVFFGADFYGQTYNQVTQIHEPQIVSILYHIWNTNKSHGRRQRLGDIQNMSAYSQLLAKMPQFKFLIDAEISLMIDQVQKVHEEPYYLDRATDRIGYRIMDSISYEASYGYRTVFAYLQEAERGNLKNRDPTLEKALAMPVSCGQFSYASISPERILGVSGTLSALGTFEYDILSKYGVNKFMYVPSVYGESNFQFDRAGEGIRIDTSKSDYFHSITEQIQALTKREKKRSVIVFFENNVRLKEFAESSFYGKLGRNKKLLTENLNAGDKDFIISKAATSGQITISTAVFGRGTDFFCKDETVQKNGGVHIIQTFLSKEQSEEIQIQGRTARQGKKGSYQMILLDSDLEDQFGLPIGMKDNVPKEKWYDNLRSARDKIRRGHCEFIEKNLIDATEKDQSTHLYFNDLLAKDKTSATNRFKEIYASFKKGSMPSSIDLDLAFALDVTGSMAPYAKAAAMTINSMLKGNGSIVEKLKIKFPDIEFHLRVGVLGYRDIGDGSQFIESVWQGNDHFTKNIGDAISFVETITRNPSGGGDIAEDHLGAIDLCTKWNSEDDWTSPIKFMLLLTDAPAHGMVPAGSHGLPNVDNYDVRHPTGLTVKSVMSSLLKNEIDLFICSFNPNATEATQREMSSVYANLPENIDQREITSIPMVSAHQELVTTAEVLGGHGKHIVFVLDQSGSMSRDWGGVVVAYNEYLARRKQNQSGSDLVSVVQFDSSADITVHMMPISKAPSNLGFSGGGTRFQPAAQRASQLVSESPASHTPLVVFMSDGQASDAAAAAGTFSQLSRNIRHSHSSDLELHVIAFGSGACTSQLQEIAGSSRNGKLHTSADTAELSNIFVDIAGGGNVAEKLEAEIGKRISDAVSDKLSIEYFA